jgi:hypothetical protein
MQGFIPFFVLRNFAKVFLPQGSDPEEEHFGNKLMKKKCPGYRYKKNL